MAARRRHRAAAACAGRAGERPGGTTGGQSSPCGNQYVPCARSSSTPRPGRARSGAGDPLGGPALAARRPRAARTTPDRATMPLAGAPGRRHGRSRQRIGSPAMAERDPDCLFCKIVAGELPATIVAEDERTVSFMDINPATRGHALVVPREHAADLLGSRRGGPVGVRRGRPAPGRARQGRARRRRRQPPELLRLGGVADRLPLPRPRDPALPRRPAAPAVGARAPATPTRSPPPARRCAPDGRARCASSATGALAVLTFDAPPLNLFDAAMIAALQAAVADVAADPPRGLLVRAEGRVVSGGVDVHLFDGLVPAGGAPAVDRAARDDPHRRGAALPDRLRRPRPVPDRGVRAVAGVRPAAGGRSRRASASWRPSSASRRPWAARSGWPSAPGPRAPASWS